MNKLTKIVATIGPASDSEEMIEKLIKAGVNIFRFNFKHNTVEWHGERLHRVKQVAERMNVAVGTLFDLQGPEIRIDMPYEEISVNKHDMLLCGEDALEKKEVGFSITHPEIIKHLEEGQRLVADDGAFSFVGHWKDDNYYLECENAGVLQQRKSLNIPGADFPFPVLVERDKEGLTLAERYQADYVALSFVRSAEDLRVVREEMKKRNCNARLMAKIETKKALDNIDEIIEEADGIMVARGDLGVELPVEQVPYYQKLLIKKCIEQGKPVVTATQMLQSMITNSYPTRAEVSDIANACFDLTDAVMLSGESATGANPVAAVTVMNNTIRYNETKFKHDVRLEYDIKTDELNKVVANAAYSVYLKLKAHNEHLAGFVVFTHSGKTAELVSRYRPHVPIYSFAPSKQICDALTLLFGVYSYTHTEKSSHEITKDDILHAIHFLHEKELIKKGDRVIILHGDHWSEGVTSTVKVVTV